MLTVGDEETASTVSSTATSNSSTQSTRYKIRLSQMADKRIVIVPVVYMLLQVWGIGANIGIYFVSPNARKDYQSNAVSSVLVLVSVSLHVYMHACTVF